MNINSIVFITSIIASTIGYILGWWAYVHELKNNGESESD